MGNEWQEGNKGGERCRKFIQIYLLIGTTYVSFSVCENY